MDLIAWAGSRLLDGLSYLPYFKGKGLLALWTVRLCGLNHQPTMRLPSGGRMWVGNDNAGHMLLPYLIGKYEHRVTRVFLQCLRRLPPDRCVVDIGANVGYYSVMAARQLRRAGSGKVFAFEPNPYAFRYLRRNTELNNLENLLALPWAVADQSGQTKIYLDPQGITIGSLRPYRPQLTESLDVQVVTLDSFMAQNPQSRIGLMKLDIEGAEMSAFLGGQETLRRDRPVILYEEREESYTAFGYSTSEVRAFLQDLGYSLHEVSVESGIDLYLLAFPEKGVLDAF